MLVALANTALILEEGARFQLLAESLGGSKLFGPGVLEQQWKMSGLWQDSDPYGKLGGPEHQALVANITADIRLRGLGL